MLILTIRTDNPDAEIGLHDDSQQVAKETWHAHRELSLTIHRKIEAMLSAQGKQFQDITGIVSYAGPGSFTGLRIGLTVANALASGLQIPVVATTGNQWITDGVERIRSGDADPVAVPVYGAPVHITKQKK